MHTYYARPAYGDGRGFFFESRARTSEGVQRRANKLSTIGMVVAYECDWIPSYGAWSASWTVA